MKTAKDLALVGVFAALLIGSQLILSFFSGVEIVTLLFLTFAYSFGVKRSVLLATAFSLLRCLIFGFFPSVVLVYLIYYNLFAVAVGLLGEKWGHTYSRKKHLLLVVVGVCGAVLFTALDDLITPLFLGLSLAEWGAYALASLTACIPQLVCAAVTVGLLFPLLQKACKKFE